MRKIFQAAQTSIYCAVSEDLDNKEFGFFRNCSNSELSSNAEDDKTARRLWLLSQNLVEKSDIQPLLETWSKEDE